MIEYRHVKKYFGDQLVIQEINMTVEAGEFLVIIGPSGCGKTTTVKMLNRLVEPSEGEILIDGVSNRERNLVELRTQIGYVIQQIGLFPNMTVEENISVVPQIMKWEKDRTRARVKELMAMVGMPYEQYAGKYPKQLSGGQQQRIGVLRALAVNPPIVIMDEPFGALDPITREILQKEVKKIQRELRMTVLFITHDMHEAMKLADRIIFMDHGRILQEATPGEMVQHPANETVSRFIQLQEVPSGGRKTAKDLMGPVTAPLQMKTAVLVRETDTPERIQEMYGLAENRRIYVQDEAGRILGEITVESLIRSLVG